MVRVGGITTTEDTRLYRMPSSWLLSVRKTRIVKALIIEIFVLILEHIPEVLNNQFQRNAKTSGFRFRQVVLTISPPFILLFCALCSFYSFTRKVFINKVYYEHVCKLNEDVMVNYVSPCILGCHLDHCLSANP